MWNDAVKNSIYTTIKSRVTSRYPKLNLTASNFGTALVNKSTPSFPYIQVVRLQGAERGQTLEKEGANAILTTFQIAVFSNKCESVCEEISNCIADVMLGEFGFSMIGEPFPDYTSTDEYRYVARYQRLIGASDTLVVNAT